MAVGVFDAKRDAELVAAGTHFYCETCLGARPLSELSPDPRYCQGCYGFLLKEAELLNNHKTGWVPKPVKRATSSPPTTEGIPPTGPTMPKKGGHNSNTPPPPPSKPQPIMSTSISPESKASIITPPMGEGKEGKKGPRYKPLPEAPINRWAKDEKMGNKAIAARLESELGLTVSYKTIKRLLSGERQLSLPM